MPIEVVLAHVQQHGDPWPQGIGEAELEGRRLDGERVPALARGEGERMADVAAGHGVQALGPHA
jgi:hypothetical protein